MHRFPNTKQPQICVQTAVFRSTYNMLEMVIKIVIVVAVVLIVSPKLTLLLMAGEVGKRVNNRDK